MKPTRKFHLRKLFLPGIALIFASAALMQFSPAKAQSANPILISQIDSTRAIAFDSVTQHREPFSSISPVRFSPDNHTRLMLFAMNLILQPGDNAASITVEAEDAAHNCYQWPVEYVGQVPDQPWASSLIVKLANDIDDVGDVLVRLRYRGLASNRVRVGIGHVGGGPPDDAGAVPTPGSLGPPVAPGLTAGNLSVAEVQTIISQAVAAAASLNRSVEPSPDALSTISA